MAIDARKDPEARRGAFNRIGEQLGVHPEALRTWVKKAEVDEGLRPGTTSEDAARMTMVFTALAVTKFMQQSTGLSLKKIVTTLRPLREFVGVVGGHEITFPPAVPSDAAELIASLQRATEQDPFW